MERGAMKKLKRVQARKEFLIRKQEAGLKLQTPEIRELRMIR